MRVESVLDPGLRIPRRAPVEAGCPGQGASPSSPACPGFSSLCGYGGGQRAVLSPSPPGPSQPSAFDPVPGSSVGTTLVPERDPRGSEAPVC